jgi:hypothetical protein
MQLPRPPGAASHCSRRRLSIKEQYPTRNYVIRSTEAISGFTKIHENGAGVRFVSKYWRLPFFFVPVEELK